MDDLRISAISAPLPLCGREERPESFLGCSQPSGSLSVLDELDEAGTLGGLGLGTGGEAEDEFIVEAAEVTSPAHEHAEAFDFRPVDADHRRTVAKRMPGKHPSRLLQIAATRLV